MTNIYFIRHAESDKSVRDGRIRPLTAKGLADRALATTFLRDKQIDVVLSSPFKRAVDTIADFAGQNNLPVELIEDFREQKSSKGMGSDKPDIYPFLERQWADFSYTLCEGESLSEVQRRNIAALQEVLTRYRDKNIVIGTHATALSTIINYYDNTYGFSDFMAMVHLLPWVVTMAFDGNRCVEINKIDLCV